MSSIAETGGKDKVERARNRVNELQMLVDTLYRAISGEEVILPKG